MRIYRKNRKKIVIVNNNRTTYKSKKLMVPIVIFASKTLSANTVAECTLIPMKLKRGSQSLNLPARSRYKRRCSVRR